MVNQKVSLCSGEEADELDRGEIAMTVGEFNELAKQGRVRAKIIAPYAAEFGFVEKIGGLTGQFIRFRFKGKSYDTIISPTNIVLEIDD